MPHAPYSSSPELLVVAISSRRGPALPTLHLDGDPAERQFLRDGTGPWADVLDFLGRNRAAFEPPGCTPVQYLERLGLLDKVALVHCTLTRDEDLDLLAERGTHVVLCPSSNLHITGMLPGVPGMVARGIPLALGTDSTASGQSLDVMGEVRILAEHFPEIPVEVWLLAATAGGGRVVGVAAELVVGGRSGLLRADPAEPWASGVERNIRGSIEG
ncbi:MAG: cytosine/adenosine deaminase-related metal-dependent hydrolase [Cognaticolwellia sp.]